MKYRLEWRQGEPVICGVGVDYVGGRLKQAWEEAFLAFGLMGRGWERVLLIGMGASLMQILAQAGQPPPARVLILEKEPEMVRLQESHFALPLPYRVLVGDAAETIHQVEGCFDGIFVDAFVEWEVPLALLQMGFLKALGNRLAERGILLWNVLLHQQARLLEPLLRGVWKTIRARHIGRHVFFLAVGGAAQLSLPF